MTVHLDMLPGKVAIQLDPPDEKIGSIYVPDSAKDNCNLGTVVAVSNRGFWTGSVLQQPCVKVGDRVLIGRYTGIDLKYHDLDLKIVNHNDVLAVLPPDTEAPTPPLGISVEEPMNVSD